MSGETRQKLASASAEVGKQKNSPTLDLLLNLTLTGRDPALGQSLTEAFGTTHPYALVGVKFAAGLDFALAKRNRAGYEKERQGAELNYQRKLMEQDSEWKGLIEQLTDRRQRLDLAREIEAAQKTKVEYERERLKRAKTSTYQVLLFEEDYANARRLRLKMEGDLLALVAQMKTFGGENESR